MNNKNKILVGCLALLLALSVGYALFSETITINGTATAKGSFDIVGTCQAGVPAELVSGIEYYFDDADNEGGYKNDTCSITGNQGSFNVDFEYPGARRFFTFKFTNNGTIPAKVGEIKATKYEVCFDDICADILDNETPDNSVGQAIANMLEILNSSPAIVGVQIGNGEIIAYNNITQAIGKEFMDSEGNYILKPGNSAFFAIEAYLSSRIGDNANGGSFDISNDVTYEFPFVQVTE